MPPRFGVAWECQNVNGTDVILSKGKKKRTTLFFVVFRRTAGMLCVIAAGVVAPGEEQSPKHATPTQSQEANDMRFFASEDRIASSLRFWCCIGVGRENLHQR